MDKAASEKKILHDVFERGDARFRTGDLMRMDADSYFHFVDRMGEAFRWKGENVTAGEQVARHLPSSAHPAFVHILPDIGTKGAFKCRRMDLVSDGIDPGKIKGAIFRRDPAG